MIDHRQILKHDVFSWTVFGLPWINHFWLWEIFLGMTSKVFPQTAEMLIRLIFYVLPLLLVGWFFFLLTEKKLLRHDQALLLTISIVALLSLTVLAQIRPALAAFALFVANVYLVFSFKERPKIIWLLPVLQLLWVNIHGSFIVGILLTAMLLFFKGKRITEICILALTVAASLINPWGLGLLKHIMLISLIPETTTRVMYADEWRSLNFHSLGGIALLSFIILSVIAFCSSKKLLKIPSLILLIATCFAGMTSARHLPYFIFFTGYFVAESSFSIPRHVWRKIFYGFIVLFLFCTACNFNAFSNDKQQYLPPFSAINYLKNHNMTEKILHPSDIGSYLIYSDIPVFTDGRADLYNLNGGVRKECDDVFLLRTDPEKIFTKWKIKTILVPNEMPLNFYLRQSSQWQRVYKDKQTVIYKKKGVY